GGSPSFAGSAAEGRCLLELGSTVELCNPAVKSAVEPPRQTSATISGSAPSSATSLLCFKAKLARKAGSGAAALAGLAPGQSISPAQRKHVPRRARDGDPVGTGPGNSFPAPLFVDTARLDAACVPSNLVAVMPGS